MSDLNIKCPNCSADIKINQPSMPFVMQGKKNKLEYNCSTCGNNQGHTGKCEKCGQKSWGIA
jgi:primosomal protein N'